MSDQHKEEYVDKNELNLEDRHNSKKRRNGIQRNRKRDTRMTKRS